MIKSIVCALRSLKVSPEIILWTDSFTTLCWIKNNRAWKTFIQTRVKEIRELTSEYEWRHCPGECNPADLPSRGCTGSELPECERWWKGPRILINPPEQWPVDPQPTRNDRDQASLEVMKNPPVVTHSLSGPTISTSSVIKRYSSKDTVSFCYRKIQFKDQIASNYSKSPSFPETIEKEITCSLPF